MGFEMDNFDSRDESRYERKYVVSDEDMRGEIFVDFSKHSTSTYSDGFSIKQKLRIIYVLQGEGDNSCYGHFFVEHDSGKEPRLRLDKVGLKSCDKRISPDVLEFLVCNLPVDIMKIIPKEIR